MKVSLHMVVVFMLLAVITTTVIFRAIEDHQQKAAINSTGFSEKW